jgi:hypothetical protein
LSLDIVAILYRLSEMESKSHEWPGSIAGQRAGGDRQRDLLDAQGLRRARGAGASGARGHALGTDAGNRTAETDAAPDARAIRGGRHLCREPGGRAYIIGDRLSRFGLDVLRNDGAATERRIVLRRVVSEIGESCNLAVLHKGALIYLDRIEANWPLRLQIPAGEFAMPPHCCASGKLLLAHLARRSASVCSS